MPKREQKPRVKRGFWRTCRLYFRGFRIAVWLFILGLVAALVYLNQIGLPEFIKQSVLERLSSRGLELRFSRLRLSWFEGIVAENVRFGPTAEPAGPELSAVEVQVKLNSSALIRRQVQVESLVLHEGRLSLPIVETNRDPRRLTLDHIQTELRFLPQDQWALDNLRASFQGVQLRLAGVVTNASTLSELPIFKAEARETGAAGRWHKRLRRFADAIENIRFSSPPELNVRLYGDARDLRSFSLNLTAAYKSIRN